MKRLFLSVLLVSICIPSAASAHGAGASLEKEVGQYKVDIGIDPEFPMGGDRMVFDFDLLEKDATPVTFDYAWVRLEQGGKLLFASGIRRADIGPTSLLYLLPAEAEGELAISVRYQKGERSLAEADFRLPVESREEPYVWLPLAVSALLGAILGAGVVFFVRPKLPLT